MSTKSTKSLLIVLESLRIATPCSADWDDMSGDDRVRFCGKCEKNVYNLVAMTRVEAETLVREKEGNLCLQLYTRADGTVLTADCPVGVRRQRLGARVWSAVSRAAVSVGLLLGLLSGRARGDASVSDGDKPSAKQPEYIAVRGEPMMVKTPTPPPPAKRTGEVKAAKPAKIRRMMGGPMAPSLEP